MVAPGEKGRCRRSPLLADVTWLSAGCAVNVECHNCALHSVLSLVLPA